MLIALPRRLLREITNLSIDLRFNYKFNLDWLFKTFFLRAGLPKE